MSKYLVALAALFSTVFLQASDSRVIDPEEIAELCAEIENSPHYRVVRNALTQNHVWQVATDWDRYKAMNFFFSHEVDPAFPVTDQKRAGLCWMFAAFNVLRMHFANELPIGHFEFSQSHLFFYDKLEKANCFLEAIIDTRDLQLTHRRVQMALSDPQPDGGYWEHFTNLAEKYGVVPYEVHPETPACNNTCALNGIISTKLYQIAEKLRDACEQGVSVDRIRSMKQKYLKEISKILILHMGAPATHFDWSYQEDDKIMTYQGITPKQFLRDVVKFKSSDYVSLMNCPRDDLPYYETYEYVDVNTMVGGDKIRFFNIPLDEFKAISVAALKDNKAVWFGCDIAKDAAHMHGIMDTRIFDLENLYNVDFSQSKASRMRYLATTSNHAMTITGVHLEDNIPLRWKVENSWGRIAGNYGFYVMTDDWFDEHVFLIAVPKKYLPTNYGRKMGKPAKYVHFWDLNQSLPQ